MTQVPVQVVVAAFKNETAANEALDELKLLQDAGQIKVDNAAVLHRDMNNQLHIRDTHDWGFGRGALAGGIVGVVLGLMTGPVGWAVLGSALVGGVSAKLHHTYGFDETRLRKLGDSLQPGNSAIVAVAEHLWVADVEAAMRKQSTDMLVESISKDVAEQLAAGSDVGYTAVSVGDSIVTERVAASESETQISDTIITPGAIYAEAADITSDHVTYGAAIETPGGAKGVLVEATPATPAKDGEAAMPPQVPEPAPSK